MTMHCICIVSLYDVIIKEGATSASKPKYNERIWMAVVAINCRSEPGESNVGLHIAFPLQMSDIYHLSIPGFDTIMAQATHVHLVPQL